MHSRPAILFMVLWIMIIETSAQKPSITISKFPPTITIADLKVCRELYITSTTNINRKGITLISENRGIYLYTAAKNILDVDSLLLSSAIVFISPWRRPVEEMVLNGSDLSLNNVSYVHTRFSKVTGLHLTSSIKENRPDTADIDFRNRFVKTGYEAPILSAHATAMGTLIAGAGNTYYTGRGVAYKSNLTSSSFQTLLPEPDAFYKNFRVSVQNHSYGTGIENFYSNDSYAYDASISNNDTLLHVFSAGNAGTQTSSSGKYAGVVGFANITGSFKQSKNTLSVAATDSFYNVEVLSSRGPAYDGRIKPELTAFGQDGSSGAAALVSGAAILIQDAYKQVHGVLPSSALVRAVLTNAADDILQPGPDYRSGFGSLNTASALRHITERSVVSGNATSSATSDITVSVPANTRHLKVTLAWNDIAALPGVSKALINDLDLEIIHISTGIRYFPWVLSSFAHADSLNAIAVRRRDTLNTIEQVTISSPLAGDYIIRVTGANVQGSQPYHIAYEAPSAEEQWFTYPTKNDHLLPGSMNTIRFNFYSGSITQGDMEISYDGGTTWQYLSQGIDLTKQFIRTAIKDTVSIARLRITHAAGSFLSDTFTISSRLNTKVGFNCTDSFSFYWNKIPNANGYAVYALTDTFMRVTHSTADTFITIHPGSLEHFAVAPVIGTKIGQRSFAFNYKTQGVQCFINSFLADVSGDSAVNLQAILSSKDYIKEVTFERLYPTTGIGKFGATTDTFFITDKIVKQGIYHYRVKLTLKNNVAVYSDTLQVAIYKSNQFFVYPNPLQSGGRLVIKAKDHTDCRFELHTLFGQKIYTHRLKADVEHLELPFLAKGMYFYRFIRNNNPVESGKLVIQ